MYVCIYIYIHAHPPARVTSLPFRTERWTQTPGALNFSESVLLLRQARLLEFEALAFRRHAFNLREAIVVTLSSTLGCSLGFTYVAAPAPRLVILCDARFISSCLPNPGTTRHRTIYDAAWTRSLDVRHGHAAMCIHIHVCIYIYIHMYMYIHNMYIYIYIYLHICIYIYIYIWPAIGAKYNIATATTTTTTTTTTTPTTPTTTTTTTTLALACRLDEPQVVII